MEKQFKIKQHICTRCKKNKATIKYTASATDYAHGFIEDICQECYDKQMKNSDWYKQGRAQALADVMKIIDECDCWEAKSKNVMGNCRDSDMISKEELKAKLQEKTAQEIK